MLFSIAADFYILEYRGKRAFNRLGPFPLGLDEIPIGSAPTDPFKAAENLSGFRFIIEESKSGSK